MHGEESKAKEEGWKGMIFMGSWRVGLAAGLVIAGGVFTAGLHIWLAATDLEYAKHDESLYAMWKFLSSWGWVAILLIVSGAIIWITEEE